MWNSPKIHIGSFAGMEISVVSKIMFLAFFVIAGLTKVDAADRVAKSRINLKFENATVKSILSSIEKQTDYIFIYNEDVINSNFKRSISVKDASIENVLDILFKGMNVELKIDGRQVYILKKTKQVQEKSPLEPKRNTVTGVITDERNQTVLGAKVLIDGGNSATMTDDNGFFSIDAPADGKLKVSFMGYETLLIDIKGRKILNATIFPSEKALEEIVVVGYGIQKKSNVTGSIAQVKSDQIRNTASSNLASALQGKVSGVYSMNSSGAAGSKVDIRIRGITSLNDVAPLWVIDGVPGDATTVNMNDVESIDVIKDGAAAAIYGVKAAAGVILVTTKRGVGQKKAKISFNAYTGTSSAWRLPEMLNSDQYVTLKNEQWASTGVPVGLSMDSIGRYPTTNWMKEMFKQGKVKNYDINISGSNESSNYFIGGNYFRNDPSFIDNSQERFSFRINTDHKITKWIKIGESLSLLYSKLDPVGDEGRYLDGIFRTPPMMPVYDANNQPGGFGYVNSTAIGNYDGGNPMANQMTIQETDHNQIISGNIYATINVVKGLTVTGTFAGDFTSFDSKTVEYPYYLSDLKGVATTNIGVSFSKSWNMLFNVYANYVKDFGLNNINLTAGYEIKQNAGSNLYGSGTNAKYGLLVLNQTDANGRIARGSEEQGRSLSQLGRITYQYDNKYILQAIVRRDGSDKFGPENRYGIFPSVSFAWKLSEESFIEDIPTISFLKLRGGYGVNGNDNIAQYQYVSLMNISHGYPYGTNSTVDLKTGIIAGAAMANPNILWERSKHLDFALELGLFKNALFFNIEPYQKSSDQMLFKKSLPLSSGLSQFQNKPFQWINTGRITNRGLDMSVTYKGDVGDFKYSLGANVSTFKCTVNQLAGNTPLLASSVLADAVQVSKTTVGETSGYFFGYKCDGIFQTQEQVDEYNNKARLRAQELNPQLSQTGLSNIYYNSSKTAPGDLIYRDLNGDGIITPEDREKIGSPWPKATYGLQGMANYKWFDLMVTTSGLYKRKVFNVSRVSMYQFSSYDYSTTTLALTRWTPDKPSTTNYRINGSDPNKNMANPSSWYIEDGSFLRIKNLELGFTIPKGWCDQFGINRLRLYVSGQNIFTFTKYKGLDPEFGIGSSISSGVDYGSYPQSKVYMMGLQVEL